MRRVPVGAVGRRMQGHGASQHAVRSHAILGNVCFVAPHREEHPCEAPGQGHDGDHLAPSVADRRGPSSQWLGLGTSRAPKAPRGLNEQEDGRSASLGLDVVSSPDYSVRRERRHSPAGANPARQLSLQPVAVGADDGGNDIG